SFYTTLFRSTEALRIAADFGEREQQVVTIEGGVLEALRLHRARVLLELHREREPALALGIVDVPVVCGGQEHAPQEIEDRRLHRGVPPARAADRRLDGLLVEVL